jgi:FtsP/CotA-like multicopper oxidase with cupredoxin domain
MQAAIPAPRERPLLTMADMGMGALHAGHGGTAHSAAGGGMDHSTMDQAKADDSSMDHAKMDHSTMDHSGMGPAEMAPPSSGDAAPHGPESHGAGNSMVATVPTDRLSEPGTGLGNDGWRVLVYRDLAARTPFHDRRPPSRELELHLTGNMERYMWSFDGEKYSEVSEPIEFNAGERLRLILVNDTMMEHPIHLHGMWMELENGAKILPRKHTVNVKPAERLSVLISAEALGSWAFHCHLLFHMEMGMFRVVRIS